MICQNAGGGITIIKSANHRSQSCFRDDRRRRASFRSSRLHRPPQCSQRKRAGFVQTGIDLAKTSMPASSEPKYVAWLTATLTANGAGQQNQPSGIMSIAAGGIDHRIFPSNLVAQILVKKQQYPMGIMIGEINRIMRASVLYFGTGPFVFTNLGRDCLSKVWPDPGHRCRALPETTKLPEKTLSPIF